MSHREKLLNELTNMQRKDIPISKKLQFTDIKRIVKYLDNSIYDKNNCTLWKGYVTNNNNATKGMYINFYFRGKKCALHRLLFINYVDNLNSDEYLKYTCNNKGKCCNVLHLMKHRYNADDNNDKNNKNNKNNDNGKNNTKKNDTNSEKNNDTKKNKSKSKSKSNKNENTETIDLTSDDLIVFFL